MVLMTDSYDEQIPTTWRPYTHRGSMMGHMSVTFRLSISTVYTVLLISCSVVTVPFR